MTSILDLRANPNNVLSKVRKLEKQVALLSRALSADGYVEVINEDPGEPTIGNADQVDGFDASATPTAGTLLALDGSALVPVAALQGIPLLQWTGAHTFPATGITIGGDVVVQRGAANRLTTPDSVDVAGSLRVGSAGAPSHTLDVDGAASISGAATLGSTLSVSGTITIGGDVVLQRGAANRLTTPDSVDVAGSLRVGSAGAPSHTLDVDGTASISGAATLGSTLSVAGTVTVDGDLAFVGAQQITTSAGNLTVAPTGDLVLDPGGSDVLPGGSIEDDLGDYNRMWRTLYAAELYVETLVAQDVMATIGGRIMVTLTTTLIADVNNSQTSIDVAHNNLSQNDYIMLKAAPGGVAQFEVMQVNSGATGITGGYRYNVARNEDGTGANSWYAGDSVANVMYAEGEGYIELTSTETVHSHLGPNITIYSRTGTSNWDDVAPTVSLGNLESFLGYSSAEFGLAAGNDLTTDPAGGGFSGFSIDRGNGLRLYNVGLELYDGADVRIKADPTATGTDPMWWMGPSSSDKRFIVTGDGDVWLSSLAISSTMSDVFFSQADGLLLLGPGCPMTATSWTSLRGQAATLSGAFHQVAGRWAGTRALRVELGTTNVVANPSVETNTTGYSSAAGTATLSRDTTLPFVGEYALKVVTDANTYNGILYNRDGVLTAETEYTASVWLRGTVGNDVRVVARNDDDSGALDSTVVTLVAGWQRAEVTFTTAVGQTNLNVRITKNNSADIETFYIDAFQVEEKAAASSYCDGSLGEGYSWSGTAHASSSVRTATAVNLDDHADVVAGVGQLSFSLMVQMPYDYDADWPRTYPTLIGYSDAAVSERMNFNFSAAGNQRFYLYINDGAANSIAIPGSTYAFVAGEWLHLVVTLDYDNNEFRTYLNGEANGTTTGTSIDPPASVTKFNVGSSTNENDTAGWAISEFAVFDVILTAEQVAALWHRNAPLTDAGAMDVPGIYILDGRFSLATSTSGARTIIGGSGWWAYDADGDAAFGLALEDGVSWGGFTINKSDLVLGHNQSGSAAILWDQSAGTFGFYGDGSATVQVEIETDGTLTAGAGAVTLGSGGIEIELGTSYSAGVFKFSDGSDILSRWYRASGGTDPDGVISWIGPLDSGNLTFLVSNTPGAADLGGGDFNIGARTGSSTYVEYFSVTTGGSVEADHLNIGGDGVTGAGQLALYNGTAPTSSVTNGVILYAKDYSSSSELVVRDEAGHTVVLSPHNFSLIPTGPSEPLAWAYYGEQGGQAINVDMLKLARLVEQMTGEQLVYIREQLER